LAAADDAAADANAAMIPQTSMKNIEKKF